MEQARRDMSAILAATKIFSAEGVIVTAYINLTRLFPRHEMPKLCSVALEGATLPISTRDVAAYLVEQKGLDGAVIFQPGQKF